MVAVVVNRLEQALELVGIAMNQNEVGNHGRCPVLAAGLRQTESASGRWLEAGSRRDGRCRSKKEWIADNNSENRLRQGGMRLMASGQYSGSGDVGLRVRGGQGLPWLATLLHDKPVIRCRAQSAGE
ncbi:hypothetical protein D3C76_1416060 [compost metagenome]